MHHRESLRMQAGEMGIGGQGLIITQLPWLPLLVSACNVRTDDSLTYTSSPRVGAVQVEQSRCILRHVVSTAMLTGIFLRTGTRMTCVRLPHWRPQRQNVWFSCLTPDRKLSLLVVNRGGLGVKRGPGLLRQEDDA